MGSLCVIESQKMTFEGLKDMQGLETEAENHLSSLKHNQSNMTGFQSNHIKRVASSKFQT